MTSRDEKIMLNWALSKDRTPKDRVIGVLSQVMGQSPEEVHGWDLVSPERVRDYCERMGARWGKLLEGDTERACNNQMPEFFLEHWLWADLYRDNHGIDYISPEGGFATGLGGLKPLSEYRVELEQVILESPRLLGWACPREQAYFYQSQEWQRCASSYRYHDGYECRLCHVSNRRQTLHVHHRHPIITAYSHNFHLNFAWWKLEALCESCHTKFHSRTVRSIDRLGYEFVNAQEVKAEKSWLKKVYAKHHRDGVCGWCNQFPESDNGDVDFYL